jgi:Biotin-protein ligase, N terminal
MHVQHDVDLTACLDDDTSRRKDEPNIIHDVKVATLGTTELLSGHWRRRCLLLVMPGGADLPYCRDLNGVGNEHISGARLGVPSVTNEPDATFGTLICRSDRQVTTAV